MQDSFTSPDGFVCVSFPDTLAPRPRMPQAPAQPTFIALLPATEIKMGWLSTYTDHTPRLRPIHPEWIGVDTAAIAAAAVAPISWMPIVLGFLNAPRLHQTFRPFIADPMSGDMMAVAQRMAWDPHPKVGAVIRPKLAAGGESLVIPLTVIAAGEDCVHLIDTAYSVPALVPQALTHPALILEAFTVPTLTTEGLC